MSLSDIVESYKLSSEFADLMSVLESKNLDRNNLYEYADKWGDVDNKRRLLLKSHKGTLIIGTLAYYIWHPKKMASAQKYYRGGFGAACPIES